MRKILIATQNKGKAKEFQQLFSPLGFKVMSLLDVDDRIDVEEDGTTFRENAVKKAETICEIFKIPTLADDSGLIVDALDGRPGVYSARYAGEPKSDEANVQKVLEELKNVPEDLRSARFHCCLALAQPNMETITVEGSCEGIITKEPIGENGFGYDPIMYIPNKAKTIAQLSEKEKNEISHRSIALEKLRDRLATLN